VLPGILMDDNGELSQLFVVALKEIFTRFDKDKDGSLNDEELDDFSRICNGEPFEEDSKQEIKSFFDVDEDSNLTLQGFLDMYHSQTSSEPQETWKDLKKMGYDDQLQKV